MKARLSTVAEAAWLQLARGLGRLSACPVQALKPCQRVLVIAPHPDDETAGCAGTLRQHVDFGDEVRVLYLTSGAASRRVPGTPEQIAALRNRESLCALQALGIRQYQRLDLPEHRWRPDDLTGPLGILLTNYQPKVIYTPSRIDGHPDHVAAAEALAMVLLDYVGSIEIRCYPVHTPLTPLLVNLAIDTSSVATAVDEAHAAYPSQAESLLRIRRLRCYSAAAHGGVNEAETFWCLDGPAFCRVHTQDGLGGNYCGPRPSAFRDPQAYVQGIRQRLALLRRTKAS
jgi:LmbE family N-acetylglucosaminyl deacetylase